MGDVVERFENSELVEVIASIDSESDAAAVFNRFSGYLKKFGFQTVALGQLTNPAMRSAADDKWFAVGNWPTEWKEHWLGKNLIIHDPIARMALKTRKPFTWRHAYEHASRFGRDILDVSREFGFADGLAIPIYAEDSPPGCVTLGTDQLDLSPRERAAVELLSVHAYMRLELLYGPFEYQEIKSLTARESEILHFAAAGKTNWEIGTILSVSEFCVRDHLSRLQRKLNCANRAHVVAVAIQRSLILP